LFTCLASQSSIPGESQNRLPALMNDRDRALFAPGIYLGLRIGEIITLKRNQLRTKDGGVRNHAVDDFLQFRRRRYRVQYHANLVGTLQFIHHLHSSQKIFLLGGAHSAGLAH
jgi:integrase